jgi:hypothetical protein
MPKVLLCDGCLENHKCATAQNPQLPLDPKNLARLLEVRENLDAAEARLVAAEKEERRASCMEPASPPAPKAPVAAAEEEEFEFIDVPEFMKATPTAPPASGGGAAGAVGAVSSSAGKM